MIDLYSIIISIIIIYGISFPTGYACIYRIFGSKLSSYPFFVMLPLYIAFGLSMLIPIYLVIAFIKMTVITPMAVLLLSIGYLISSKKSWQNSWNAPNESLSDEILPFIFFIVTLTYFIIVADYMKWPPPGDIVSAHAPLVSLIEVAGKIPIYPSTILILYPPGFHALVATFNSILKLYPAEAVFLMGTSIIILIPLLLYSLTYITTRSKIFSSIAFFATFLIHPSGNLEKWVVGYYFNGLYPCLTGFLIILTFIIVLALLNLNSFERDLNKTRIILMISFLISLSLVFTYPAFALLTIMYSILILIIYHRLFFNLLKIILGKFNKKSNVFIVIIILALLGFLYYFIFPSSYIVGVLISYLKGSYFPGGVGIGEKETAFAYALSPLFFIDNLNGPIIIIAYFGGIYLILRWKKLDVPLFFIITASVVFLSVSRTFYQFIFYILPNRSVIILTLLGWPIFFMTVIKSIEEHSARAMLMLTNKVSLPVHGHKRMNKSYKMVKLVAVVIILGMFAPSLSRYFSLKQLEAWGWFSHQAGFTNDFAALEWINKNIKETDLILNDASHISNYLWGLSIKNLTGHPWMQFVYAQRFNDLLNVWKNPRDMEYILEVLKKYNVQYIFSTSEWGYQLYGERHGYYPKPYSPQDYARIFDNYPFLKPVFKAGSTRVYKVISTDIELKPLKVYDLESLSANAFWNKSDAWNIGGAIGTPLLSNVEQRIDIPNGNFSSWGIYHYFQGFEEWPREARYISILVYAKFDTGLSLLVWDINENMARYDFVLTGGNWNRVFLDILNPSEQHGILDTTKIKGFALIYVTGSKPRPGNFIYIKYIKLFQVRVVGCKDNC
jgi:hypothetical protein